VQKGRIALRKQWLLFVTALAIPALLAASAPKMLLSWKNPNYSGGRFANILVLALNGKAENRAEFEDELVAAIARPGIEATQSYVFLARPNATPVDLNDLKAVIREQGFDAIVVARLTKAEKKTTYVPGQVYSPYPYYGSLAAYYGAVSPGLFPRIFGEREKRAGRDKLLFDRKTRWRARVDGNHQYFRCKFADESDQGTD
jgi:hypothetical protein